MTSVSSRALYEDVLFVLGQIAHGKKKKKKKSSCLRNPINSDHAKHQIKKKAVDTANDTGRGFNALQNSNNGLPESVSLSGGSNNGTNKSRKGRRDSAIT